MGRIALTPTPKEDRIIVMAPVIMPHTEAPKFLSDYAHPAADQLNFHNSVGVHNNEHWFIEVV